MVELTKINSLISGIRSLQQSNREVRFPLSFVSDGTCHKPVDPMLFKVGAWTSVPAWPGLTCFGVTLSKKEVVIICDVNRSMRLGKQEHGPWRESIVMVSGTLKEELTGEEFTPGAGVYSIPAGVVHSPTFLTPARCVITWTRD